MPAVARPAPFTRLLGQKDERASKLLAIAVCLSYLCWTAALIVAIVWSHLKNTPGLPVGAVISMLPISFICGWFPSTLRGLGKDGPLVDDRSTWLWRVWSALLFYLLVRLMQNPPAMTWAHVPVQFVGMVCIALFVMGATQWAFLLFLNDAYANVTWPFLGVLPMTLSYVSVLTCPDLVGQLSLASTWLILIGMILLFTALFLRGLHVFYPGYSNLAFPAWVFLLSIGLMFVYAIVATKMVMKTDGLPTLPIPIDCPGT